METQILLIDLHFLPCLEYFTWLLPYDHIEIEIYNHYQKQTYSNRCYILTSQKVDRLTVPIVGGKQKSLYKDVKIDYQQRWPIRQWRSICTAYGKAPYFTYLADYFRTIFFSQYTYLYQFNLALLNLCLEILGMQKTIKLTQSYIAQPPSCTLDARHVIRPQETFIERGYYRPFCYQQVFGTIFTANLSIIDLLFCKGPEAYEVLKNSCISSIET